MERARGIAGHFKKVIEKQKVQIMQNVHVRDENGNLLFKEDLVTPEMKSVVVEIEANVENEVWVEQVNIPFTSEEEEAADAEEALWEYEKTKPIPLTDRQEMDLLLDEGADAVKAKRSEHQKAMESYLAGYAPLVEIIAQKHNAVVEAEQRSKLDAVVEG